MPAGTGASRPRREPAGDGPAFGQDGNGGVVTVQPRGGVHMLLDERLDRGERCRRRRADVIGHGGDVERNAFPGVALARAVERLRRHGHPLPWQMRRQGSARRARPHMGTNHGSVAGAGAFGGRRLVLGHGLFELGELELELLDQPAAALAGSPEPLAASFGREQPEALDLELGAGHHGFGVAGTVFGLAARVALGQDHGVRGGQIGRQRGGLGRHIRKASTGSRVFEYRNE